MLDYRKGKDKGGIEELAFRLLKKRHERLLKTGPPLHASLKLMFFD